MKGGLPLACHLDLNSYTASKREYISRRHLDKRKAWLQNVTGES